MRFLPEDPGPVREEADLLAEHLPLGGLHVLELGCGRAALTLELARRFAPASWVATDVVPEGLEAARALPDMPECVRFQLGGAEAIDLPEASQDAVLLFKSLHHVQAEALDQALDEIHRVLRPGGHVWVSEPLFAGPFNEMMRLFHDEEEVRRLAFDAVGRALSRGRFELVGQHFFRVASAYASWEDFRERFLDPAGQVAEISPSVRIRIEELFRGYVAGSREAAAPGDQNLGTSESPEGVVFLQPMRVDLLRHP